LYFDSTSEKKKKNPLIERVEEVAEAFGHFRSIKDFSLGRVVEFGCGPFTQLRNIMMNQNVTISSVVLVDPLIYDYKKIPGCTYEKGSFLGYRAELVSSGIECFRSLSEEKFDTVIMINVLEYGVDALKILTTLYDSLKVKGLLIFQERWYEDSVKSSKCITYDHDPIQVRKPLLEHFLSHFEDRLFFNSDKTEVQRARGEKGCRYLDDEREFTVVARKVK